MAWVDRRKRRDGTYRYRVRDYDPAGKAITVVRNAGMWKQIAEQRKYEYEKAKAAGSASPFGARSVSIEDFCDIYLREHGPSLKGGVSAHWGSAYYNLGVRLGKLKRAWAGETADSINPHHIRDFLAGFKTVGSRLKYLNMIGHMFKSFEEWNEDGTVKPPLKLPPANPAKKWRAKMKASDKRELPLERVLSPEEWNRFKVHLTPRGRAICEMALRRFLRMADIRELTHLNLSAELIKGVQEKTGEPFRVPVLANQPVRYDFKNFRREFARAKVAAGLDKPVGHPLHFTVRDLRRTGATWAYRQTKDIDGIRRMLGHRKVSTTIRYLQLDQTDLAPIARAVDLLAGGVPVESSGGNRDKSSESTHTIHTPESH